MGLGLRAGVGLLCGICSLAAQGVITTVAGNQWVFPSRSGSAISAPFGGITGVAVDPAGNVYAVDFNSHLVVKVTPAGTFTVVAGNGIQGFSGDGGLAINASMSMPIGIALDANGNLYIADSSNNVIRKVSADGIIRTFAESVASPHGLAVDASGNLYVADTFNHRIRKISPAGAITTVAGTGVAGFSGDGGSALSATLNTPRAVAVDGSGNLYVADTSNDRIRMVSAAGTITTVAQAMPGVFGLLVDAAGNLLASSSSRVSRIAATGAVSVVAGQGNLGFSGDGGPAVTALLNFPQGLALDGAGNLYIADFANYRVRRVNAAGVISTVAGNGLFKFAGDGGPATGASLFDPRGVAVSSSGDLYIAETPGNRIRKVAANGTITTVTASLLFPWAVTLDAAGNLYIADTNNYRVRKVSPGGIISTVAGNGIADFSGDGGPATSASLGQVTGVAVDAGGNLYIADSGNQRIRRVTSGGIISTIAGDGSLGFSGDGGPAANAKLSEPFGMAVDASGNLYFADSGNNRIRRIATNGTISTIAGNGTAGYSGDGGPAASAAFQNPFDVALDAVGNLYIADTWNHCVRKVTGGIVSMIAGKCGAMGASGDGGAATDAYLSSPYAVALDAAGNVYIADADNDRVRVVLASAPSFSVAPASLTFTAPAGAADAAPQQITILSAVAGVAWTAQASTQSGAWPALSAATGTTPGAVIVSVSATSLSPGTYQGTVTIRAPLATPSTVTVPVTLTVTPALPAQLSVEPGALSFDGRVGSSDPSAQTLRIANTGGGTLNWTAQAASTSSWLRVSPASGSASSGSPAALSISVALAGLSAGVYSGQVNVTSSSTNETKSVPVTLLLAQGAPAILVSQSGLLFAAVQGSSALPPQSVGVLNVGQGTMPWTAEASTLAGGSWLRVSPTSGVSVAASTQVPLIDLQVDVSNLTAGRYAGLVRVSAPSANNNPQFITVDLNVLPATGNPGSQVRPTGLIFTGQAGASSPGSQTVQVSSTAPGSVSFVGGLLTASGGDWLQVLPRNATLAPGESRTLTFQPTTGSLTAGVYRAVMTLLFSDGSLQHVNVLFVVTAPAVNAAVFGGAYAPCVPSRLVAVNRSLGAAFSSPVGWPSLIEVQVADDCGAAVINATVVATFSTGDAPLVLNSLRNGTYSGTWRPITAATTANVKVRASLPPLQSAELQTIGQVTANTSVPVLYPGGIVNGASFAKSAALSPGSIVSVFGQKLASGPNYAVTLPLERTLGGATLTIGGLETPLFFAGDGQVNAQIPFELASNSRPQAFVRARDFLTVPDTLTVGAVQPGCFTINQQGSGQGAILNPQGRLVDSSAPAQAGDVVEMFCTGLGPTQPAVASGQPAPSTNLAMVTNAVDANVGGKVATVQFAGLAPGFVGLYQVNVQIPAGVTPGAAVPVVLTQSGVASNTVTLAVH